jgi:hypothetical protein
MSRVVLRLAAPGLLGVLVACDQPPTQEIASAEAAVVAAEKADASTYAPERLQTARAALEQARQRVAARDYRGALSAANDASEKARAAAKSAEAAKRLAESAATLARSEAQIALDEIPPLREEAQKARIPDEAFATVEAEVVTAQALILRVDEALQRADFLGAQKEGEAAKATASALPDKFRQARADWEAAHPPKRVKGRPAKKK